MITIQYTSKTKQKIYLATLSLKYINITNLSLIYCFILANMYLWDCDSQYRFCWAHIKKYCLDRTKPSPKHKEIPIILIFGRNFFWKQLRQVNNHTNFKIYLQALNNAFFYVRKGTTITYNIQRIPQKYLTFWLFTFEICLPKPQREHQHPLGPLTKDHCALLCSSGLCISLNSKGKGSHLLK